jgi:hypothetical protein
MVYTPRTLDRYRVVGPDGKPTWKKTHKLMAHYRAPYRVLGRVAPRSPMYRVEDIKTKKTEIGANRRLRRWSPALGTEGAEETDKDLLTPEETKREVEANAGEEATTKTKAFKVPKKKQEQEPVTKKRKRGRPKKSKTKEIEDKAEDETISETDSQIQWPVDRIIKTKEKNGKTLYQVRFKPTVTTEPDKIPYANRVYRKVEEKAPDQGPDGATSPKQYKCYWMDEWIAEEDLDPNIITRWKDKKEKKKKKKRRKKER